MADEQKPPESEKNSLDFLDVLKGKIGKITALLTAVVGLVVGVNHVLEPALDLIHKIKPGEEARPKPPEPVKTVVTPPALGDCFKPKMIVDQEMVPISKWNSMMLQLTGRNDCQESLRVYVAFRGARDNHRVRVESPFVEQCPDIVNPTCWEQTSIDSGDLHRKVKLPYLRFLSQPPLGDQVKLSINWNIYDVQTKGLLSADTVQITLQDDP